ncbi:hypothetical protein PENSPDRAFT_594049, partial [Peniophora sp. CONT]
MCQLAKLSGGLSGYLRQEFRELELLNEITRLRWEGKLKPNVGGNTRSTLLKSYLRVYGQKHCPQHVHNHLKWGDQDPLKVDYDDDNDFVWKEVGAASSGKNHAEKDTNPRKRKWAETASGNKMDISRPAQKKQKTARIEPFRGLIWDSETQSCAYDSALTIFLNIYSLNVRKWQDTVCVNN